MNNQIKNAILNGRAVLFLGAGASSDCKDIVNNPLLMGDDLAKDLASEFGLDYSNEDLGTVYSVVINEHGQQVIDYLETRFKNTKPSESYKYLVQYPFFRVYTTNIDDSFEKAAFKINRVISIINRQDKIIEFDQTYKRLDLIKLNGSITHPDKGFIFSQTEYGKGSANTVSWYEQLAQDFNRFTFIFIGTKLNEPLFEHYVEKYRLITGEKNIKSYLIVPELTNIQAKKFNSRNIEFIAGSLTEFIDWLKKEVTPVPTSEDIFFKINPHLKGDLNSSVDSVFTVNSIQISLIPKPKEFGYIKEFYKGTKPTWHDVADEIPVFLSKALMFSKKIIDNYASNQFYLITGPAGSGKTTSLMQIALDVATNTNKKVYYLNEFIDNFEVKIENLTKINKDEVFFIVIERIADLAGDLSKVLLKNNSNAIFITAENIRMWNSRAKKHLAEQITAQVDLAKISDLDAVNILKKIEKHGHWTRLEKISPKNRKIELLKKSNQQLLIGLIETTLGQGYSDIIKKEYFSIKDPIHKSLLLLVGIATENRAPASIGSITRALSFLGYDVDVQQVANEMAGLIYIRDNSLFVRHRVYAEKLFSELVSPEEMFDIIGTYLKAFSVYDFPLAKKIPRKEFAIYKHLSNNKTLKKFFRGDESLILNLYKTYEKDFEQEGLFLLQYSLALRSLNMFEDALEKVIIANYAFPNSNHIEHALAQTKLIIAINCNDEERAFALFYEAQEILEKLNLSADSSKYIDYDSYPLITLIEGHIGLLINYKKYKEANEFAVKYFNVISKNAKLKYDNKANKLKDRLFKYTVNKQWRISN